MHEGKRLLGSRKCRWEDNFKIDLPGIKLSAWITLARVGDGLCLFNTKIRGSKTCGEFLDNQLHNTLLA
jgi:hypothetical protein